jgi:hypothetical protein
MCRPTGQIVLQPDLGGGWTRWQLFITDRVSPLMSRCLDPAAARVGISMEVAQIRGVPCRIGGDGCNGGDGDCGGNSGEWWQLWRAGLGLSGVLSSCDDGSRSRPIIGDEDGHFGL